MKRPAIAVAVVIALAAVVVSGAWRWVPLAAAVLAAAVVVTAVYRFARLPGQARRYWLPARWHKFRWHRVSRNLRLGYEDRHLGGIDSPRSPAVVYPRARFRPDPFGFRVSLKLIPGVSRAEVEKNADHLANAFGAWRIGITQPKPNRLHLRVMRRDPLAEPLGSGVLQPFDGRRVLLGLDEFGNFRHASLANLSGSVIGGNPGRGKSQAAAALAVQLAPRRTSQWYLLDGGGGADWSCWADRALRFATDELAEARDVLEDAHAKMAKRLASLQADLGTRNAWTIGPSPDYPLVWVVLDESSVYLDVESAKAHGKDAEQQVRAIRALVMGMMRRGRKVMFHTTLLAQKATSSSIPPDIRDLAGLRYCFGVSTTEAGIAVLGDDLRQYPAVSPTGLQGDEHCGVATARLRTGQDPYVRIRVPYVDEDQADEAARACLLPADLSPDDAPVPEFA